MGFLRRSRREARSSRMEGVAVHQRLSPLCQLLGVHLDSVSALRPSNRGCGSPARGSRSRSCLRSREATLPLTQTYQAVVHPQPLPREAHGLPGQHLVLPAFPSKGAPDGGFGGNGWADAAGPDGTGPFCIAPTAHCQPQGGADSIWRSRRLRSLPDWPDPPSMNDPDPTVRSAARLGRFRSGLRWPTHAYSARPRVKG